MSAIRDLDQIISARPREAVLRALLREGVEARHACGRGSCRGHLHCARCAALESAVPV